MTKFRIGDIVISDNDGVRTGTTGIGVVTGTREHGAIAYVEFDHNPNISRSCLVKRLRRLTREERAVRIAKKAMRIAS